MFLNVKLDDQHEPIKAKFMGPVYLSKGFREKFGRDSFAIAMKTLVRIGQRVGSPEGAHFIQKACIGDDYFFVADDGINVTYFLESEN